MKHIIIICSFMVLLSSCNSKPRQTQKHQGEDKIAVVVPVFSGDSAYSFVAQQVAFGPRVPGTPAHEAAAQWLETKLGEYADAVYVQEFRTRIYNGMGMDGKNIIASFNPQAKKRIVLAAHWDSRPFADHDEDSSNWNKAIDGANDGASGVGVLIEMARLFKKHPLQERVGVDIVLFDLEDYGPPYQESEKYYTGQNHWALGSQYWASVPHQLGYRANYGILLDMVGGAEPNFPKEYYSQQYAGWLSDKVWNKAIAMGYGDYFVNTIGDPISDDHLPMNEIAGIPTIDIIDLNENSVNECFPDTWHTINDDIDHIVPSTLEMVGKVLCEIIYNE